MDSKTVSKVDVPYEHWDRFFSPVACVVMITTVDTEGRINAASFATCVRVNHEPTCIAFTVEKNKDTYHNVLATQEFVVNIPSFDRAILEKVRIVGVRFARGVNELEKAGLTAIPARVVKPPRIEECKSHFECKVEWVKEWLNRLMVVGRVVAASANEDCVDKDGYAVLEKLRPAHYCGKAFKTKLKDGALFVAAYETMEVDMIYQGPEVEQT
ncbi:MAG: flavin reductase family protein [Deltaproteobacteria bacterium]|nr:flavin reductase family protein [Deltaproteobacteria bacterium]